MPEDHSYRDELGAAHERIAELEALLAEKLGEKAPPVTETLERLETDRIWIRGTSTQQSNRSLAFTFFTVAILVAVAVTTTAPSFAVLLPSCALLILLEYDRRSRKRHAAKRLADVERHIDAIKRDQIRSAPEPKPKTRIALEPIGGGAEQAAEQAEQGELSSSDSASAPAKAEA